MKKKQISLGILALIITGVLATTTVLLLSRVNNSTEKTPAAQQEEIENTPDETASEAGIDQAANKKAQSIEDEAASLIESNPEEAQNKYAEAEKVYEEAGNLQKVGEMRANAMTAQLLADQKAQQEN